MSKLILTTEDELEALIKRVVRDELQQLISKGDIELPKDTNEVIDIKQASELMGVSVQTIYGKTSTRMIPHYKKGKKIYFKRDELLAWLTEDKRKTRDEVLAEWESSQMLRNQRRRK